jgi:hypothetical protein
MPILSIYKGDSELSFLYYASSSNYKFYRFPYVYLPQIFDFSREDFYNQVLSHVSKKLKFPKTSCDYIISGYPVSNDTGLEAKYEVKITDAVAGFGPYTCIYVDRFKLITSDSFASYCPLPTQLSYDVANLYSNLQIYPHIRPSSEAEAEDVDDLIRGISLRVHVDISKKRPVLVSGSRFVSQEKIDVAEYLLILDLVKDPGIFDFRMDAQNVLPPLALLNNYDSNLFGSLNFDFPHYGTVLNAGGSVECLFESYSGKTQLISVNKDELFVLPLASGESARLVVKNNILGSFETEVTGGALGFLIDARDKFDENYFQEAYRQRFMSSWKKVLSESIKGF